MSEKNISFASKDEAAQFDAAKRAEVVLDAVLHEETPEDIIARELRTAEVDEERRGRPILDYETNRTMSRVLFITTDQAYLEPKSAERLAVLNLALLCDEMHILVLTPLGSRGDTKRIADNIWIYRASAQYWWKLPWAALGKVKEELVFADGFRPDLIVGLDPFESGLAAQFIASKYNRANQIHVTEDFYSNDFLRARGENKWRARLARFVLNRAISVRASTETVHKKIQAHFSDIPDLRTLPQFHNFKSLLEAEPMFTLRERYPDFVFTIVAFGPLTADSHLHDVFSALHFTLHNPRIGLIVIGAGPAKKLFQEKVKLLDIEKNVVFLNSADHLPSYLKTANVMVEADTTSQSEDMVLKAAAAGLPMVLYKTPLREDLFTDNETAGLCEPGDVICLAQKVKDLLNNQALRVQYENGGRDVVETRLIEDKTTYYRAYRDSIELALSAASGESEPPEAAQARATETTEAHE